MTGEEKISIIAAMGKNRVIGVGNELPWNLPFDMKHFMRLTSGHSVIMGRRTHESIGEVLPGRQNIVLTRRSDYLAPGCIVVNSLEEALERASSGEGWGIEVGIEEVFIIGGGEIFREFLPIANRLYMTVIDHEFNGDVYFPEIDPAVWIEVNREQGERDAENSYVYHFITFIRNQ